MPGITLPTGPLQPIPVKELHDALTDRTTQAGCFTHSTNDLSTYAVKIDGHWTSVSGKIDGRFFYPDASTLVCDVQPPSWLIRPLVRSLTITVLKKSIEVSCDPSIDTELGISIALWLFPYMQVLTNHWALTDHFAIEIEFCVHGDNHIETLDLKATWYAPITD